MNKMVIMYFLCGVVLIAVTFGGLWMRQRSNTTARESMTTNGVTVESTVQPTTSLSSAKEAMKEQSIRLVVTAPVDQYVSSVGSVIVKGNTVPNAEVNVNESEIKADASGNFSVTVSLDEGENTIMVVANDAEGKAVEKDIIVTYVPAQ